MTRRRRHRPTTCVCAELAADSLCVMRGMPRDEIRHVCLVLNLWADNVEESREAQGEAQGGAAPEPLLVFHDAYSGNLTLGGVISYAALILRRRGHGQVGMALLFE